MPLWILILLLPLSTNIHALSCVDFDKDEYISMIDFDRNHLTQVLEQFSTYGNLRECRVRVIVDHADQTIQLQFNKMLQNESISVGIVYVHTEVIVPTNDDIHYIHALTTTCSNFDGCEKKFILDHIDWLLQTQFDTFFKLSLAFLQGEEDDLGK